MESQEIVNLLEDCVESINSLNEGQNELVKKAITDGRYLDAIINDYCNVVSKLEGSSVNQVKQRLDDYVNSID